MWLLENLKLHTWFHICGPHYISTGQYWSKSVKCSQQWLSKSLEHSVSENGQCRIGATEAALSMPVEGGQRREREDSDDDWRLREARNWAGPAGRLLQWRTFQTKDLGTKVCVATAQKAPKWCIVRPEHPTACLTPVWTRVAIPVPHLPQDRPLLPLRFPDLHSCIPLPGLRLDLQPCFPKAGLTPPPPAPRGLLQPPLPNRVTRNAAPLLK